MPPPPALQEFLAHLKSAQRVPRPEGEDWSALIARITVPGTIAEIDHETFFYFLEVLPPKFQTGGAFAFAEGAEELRLFWRSGKQYLCRQLTWDETKTFCQLTGTAFPYWF
jgi:hypothetical protein